MATAAVNYVANAAAALAAAAVVASATAATAAVDKWYLIGRVETQFADGFRLLGLVRCLCATTTGLRLSLGCSRLWRAATASCLATHAAARLPTRSWPWALGWWSSLCLMTA